MSTDTSLARILHVDVCLSVEYGPDAYFNPLS